MLFFLGIVLIIYGFTSFGADNGCAFMGIGVGSFLTTIAETHVKPGGIVFSIIVVLIGILVASRGGSQNTSSSGGKSDMSSYDRGMLDGFSGVPTENMGDDLDYDQGFFDGMYEAEHDSKEE